MSWLSDLLRRIGGTRISLGTDDEEIRDRDRDGIPDEFDDRDDRDDRTDTDDGKDDDSGDSDDGGNDSDGGGDDGGSDD